MKQPIQLLSHIAMSLLPAVFCGAVAAQDPVVYRPVELLVQPERVELSHALGGRQLVVTGRYADGALRDLTHLSKISVAAAEIAEVAGGFVMPRQNGSTTLTIEAGGQKRQVSVTVHGLDKPQPVSFRNDVIAALNVGGCNAGACHGSPQGRGGFKLSLRGYDPAEDFVQLTRDVLGRRTSVNSPDASLMLKKALGQIPHEGGVRFGATSIPARTIHAWLQHGFPDDAANLAVPKKIEVLPGARVMTAPGRVQQLAVIAHLSDGSARDVTRLTVFTSSDSATTISPTGLVEFQGSGEVAILCRYLEHLQTVRLTYLEPKPGFVWPQPPENNFVDKHVFAKLKVMNIQPSELCSDTAFLRRAYLDVCGILPTPGEVKTFLADTAPDKRAKLIDSLLERPEYADFWTLKWLDVMRNSRKALQPQGASAYQAWVRGHVKQNTPLDRMVREILTAKGNTFTSAPANFFVVDRTPQELVETTAQLFCGIRIQCAQCHNHPWERWTQDDYYGMAAFFARVKRSNPNGKAFKEGAKIKKGDGLVIATDTKGEVTHLRTGKTAAPKVLGGPTLVIAADKDRREVLADWLVSAENPFFAKSYVNRIWFHLLGRGIVDPVDDFRDSNPSANDELLDALARDFTARGFDVKHVIRTIMNSRTYQLSARVNESNSKDTKYFSRSLPRLLTAEQLLDALCAVTEVPENFKGMPTGTRAAQLPDGEGNHPFLKAFGQPARQTPCECERSSEASLARALHMVNGPTINAKLTSPKNRLSRLLARNQAESAVIEEIYLATFARRPTPEETRAALDHVAKNTDKRKAWEDIQWALLNAREFLFRN